MEEKMENNPQNNNPQNNKTNEETKKTIKYCGHTLPVHMDLRLS